MIVDIGSIKVQSKARKLNVVSQQQPAERPLYK